MLNDFIAVYEGAPLLFQIFAFVFGAIVGSFLNVCIYRIPAKKSIVSPGSTCACGKPIAWYENIPILSWFILRGKARCCGQSYSFRYPFIELLAGLLFLAAWITQDPAKAGCIMVFISMLICASFIDFDHMEIPDRFSLGLAFTGVVLSVIVPSLHGISHPVYMIASMQSLIESLIGVLVGSGIILWLALVAEIILRKEAMGFGDVKLLGGIGAFTGWQGSVFALLGGSVIGLFGLCIWMLVKQIMPSLRKSEDDGQLFGKHTPFGPMLSAGAIVYFLLAEDAVNDYFEMFASIVY